MTKGQTTTPDERFARYASWLDEHLLDYPEGIADEEEIVA